MGYQTALMVLNDRWHEAMNNPHYWVESIEEQMRRLEGGEAAFQTAVCRSHHADGRGIYMTHGNRMYDLTGHPDGVQGFTLDDIDLAIERLVMIRRLHWEAPIRPS